MGDKRLYILAGYDDETSARLQNIQNKLYACGFSGTQTRNIPLHITLGSYPTSFDKEAELSALIRELADKTDSFEISCSGIGIFDGMKVLYIAPDVNEELLRLKKIFGDIRGWTAHTTMIIDEQDVLLKALPIVMNEFSPLSGKITTLHLYEFFPTRHILSVNLR
ncbi:MAG: 2'-5' RNA ligase family protein [Clostridia bacterium]|nr:2'-5' RNA ligase family protein [Clostridia bacterium]